MRLSIKLALLGAILVVAVAGLTSYLLVFRFRQASELELVTRDRELAQVLASLRDARGQLDFETLSSFVSSSDRVDTGLVYALLLDRAGAKVQGALNPRLFAKIDPRFQQLVNSQGRQQVLDLLVASRLDRRGLIKEYGLPVPGGRLRLGFDLRRIDEQLRQQSRVALLILAGGLLVGVLGAMLLARQLGRPIRRLASAMEAVASGDLEQTVQVSSRDEIAALAGSFNRMLRTVRELRRLEQIVTPYLSAAVLARILREEHPLELVTEDRLTTVVSLVLGPGLDRTLEPRERLSLVNEHLAPAIDALQDHGGVILQLDRHTLRAVWNTPEDTRDAELAALRGALAARRAVADESRRQSLAGAPALAAKMGVATGQLASGNVGSIRRVTYGVLGDAVEIADLVVAMAAPGEILATESTVSKVRDQLSLTTGPPLIVEGFDEAIPLYRLR